MTPAKQARVMREWFLREKRQDSATRIVAKSADVCVDSDSMRTKRRPSMFTLIISHEDGDICVPINSEILGKWKKEISEFNHMFWLQGQHVPYDKYGK